MVGYFTLSWYPLPVKSLPKSCSIMQGSKPQVPGSGSTDTIRSTPDYDGETSVDFDEVPPEALEVVLRDPECADVAEFPSAEGAHYVTYTEDEGLVAVYSGPSGPENRPANISDEAFRQLAMNSNGGSLLELDESPFSELVLIDLL